MTAELLRWLCEATLATSVAVLFVLAVRRPLRNAAGSGAAYVLWLLVPVAAIGVLLPAGALPALPAPVLPPAAASAFPVRPDMVVAPIMSSAMPVLSVWVAGMLVAGAWLARSQHRFVASLGTLRPRPDGMLQSAATAGLPAVLGWRARIVLPGDFDVRYDACERELVLCHERVHQRRGDLQAAVVAAMLRCIFWFNPLLQVAAARFRDDQELACDAVVLRRYPASRRAYGAALLKTQLADQPLPIGCHWFGAHPLKERIAMLKRPVPSSTRHLLGLLLAFLAVSAGGTLVWAGQPATPLTVSTSVPAAPPGKIGLAMEVKIDGGAPRTLTGVLDPHVSQAFAFDADGEHWRIEAAIAAAADGTFDLTAKITRDGEVVGEPRMIFKADTGATVGIGEQRPDGSFDGIAIELRAQAGPGPAAADAATTLPAPPYPASALAAGEGGVVMLTLRVGTDGRVVEAVYDADGSTVGESSALVQAARDAAMQWQLEAAVEAGRPVESLVRVPVRFEPDDG